MARRALYKMGTLARLTGLAPVLLRAWERRHGLLAPERTRGGHRLYTEDDLRILGHVQAQLAQGRAIGEVAVLGRPALLAAARAREGAPARPPASAAPGGALGLADELARAAVELDAARAERALDQAFAALAPERAIGAVLEPAMRAIGELWAEGRCSVAGEHLVAGQAIGRVQGLLEAAGASARGPRALCACFPDEQHALGSLVVAFWLARRGRQVTWLGAALPLEDLEAAIERLSPEDVLLSVSRAALLEAHAPRLRELVGRRPRVRFHVGGAGARAAGEVVTAAGARLVEGASVAELEAALALGDPAARRARRRRSPRG